MADTPTHKGVTVGYLHGHEVGHNFHRSLLDAVMLDGMGPQMLANYLPMNANAGGIDDARNVVVAEFLDLETEWLWWLDTDMGFRSDTLYRLLESADPDERPIVGALCYAWRATSSDNMNGFIYAPAATLLDYTELEGGGRKFVNRTRVDSHGLTQVGATGSACVVVHRTVYERMRDELADQQPYDRIRAGDGKYMSEDVSFCVRAGALGIPVWVDQGVHTNHLKHLHVGPLPPPDDA